MLKNIYLNKSNRMKLVNNIAKEFRNEDNQLSWRFALKFAWEEVKKLGYVFKKPVLMICGQVKVDRTKIPHFIDIWNIKELKKAYRKASIETHPDKNGGNNELFTLMQLEYEYILNELEFYAEHADPDEYIIKMLHPPMHYGQEYKELYKAYDEYSDKNMNNNITIQVKDISK